MLAVKIEKLYKSYPFNVKKEIGFSAERLLEGINRDRSGRLFKTVLDNINLDIKCGERIGLLGKNGAGKSTLLKILSRVTSPTSGKVTIDGKLASLLEVGTGFHPELTGIENIYLSGGVLGMSGREIKSRLDEIIDFSEVGNYINLPVKRYSSGMYVKLAFSVATHLRSDIIILDEVLSVGDMAFQERSRRKMEEITQDGKTVIFVSHAVGSVKAICNKVAIIESGKISDKLEVQDGLNQYLGFMEEIIQKKKTSSPEIDDNFLEFSNVLVWQEGATGHIFDHCKDINLRINLDVKKNVEDLFFF